jgi:hypothetical protein
MVKTRSQTKLDEEKEDKGIYKVNIDFDEASEAWKQNKLSQGNGTYRYRCLKPGKNGAKCIKKCLPNEDFCLVHYRMTFGHNYY